MITDSKKAFSFWKSSFKTKIKRQSKRFFYGEFGQKIVCAIIIAYIKFVYLTSRKIFLNQDLMLDKFKNQQSLIIAGWHNRIMMTPFIIKQIKKVNKVNKISSLTSKHGDGRFVGKVMEKFGAVNIYGSSRSKKHLNRGIDIGGLKDIFRALKNELGVAISPDGPRGPANKINGEIIKIAKLSAKPILPASIGYSKFFQLNSWDKFKIPLPFSVICYCYGEPIFVNKNINDQEILQLNLLLEEQINQTAKTADQAVGIY